MDINEVLGQIFSFVAVILGFLSFQVKTDKSLIVLQIATSIVFVLSYFFLGAVTAAVLNTVGILRNIIYYNKDKKFYSKKIFPALFVILMILCGAFSWSGIHSLLVIAGIGINTYCLSFDNPQNIRKSILFSSPLVLIYDILEFSTGGIIYETVVIISSIIGIIRYKNQSITKRGA